jgi:hypothetical protein
LQAAQGHEEGLLRSGAGKEIDEEEDEGEEDVQVEANRRQLLARAVHRTGPPSRRLAAKWV